MYTSRTKYAIVSIQLLSSQRILRVYFDEYFSLRVTVLDNEARGTLQKWKSTARQEHNEQEGRYFHAHIRVWLALTACTIRTRVGENPTQAQANDCEQPGKGHQSRGRLL